MRDCKTLILPFFTARIERHKCALQARSLSLRGWGLIDLPLRATFSPAHPLARRDVPLARAGESATARCASTGDHQAPSLSLFCEQEERSAYSLSSF